MPEIHRLPVTGANQERAAENAQQLIDLIQAAGEAGFEAQVEAAWRAARGQSRWIVAGRTRSELLTALAELVLDGSCVASGQHRSGGRRVTFVCSGMGPQWARMGRGLALEIPAFARRVNEIDGLLAVHHGGSVWEELAGHDPGDVLPTRLAQPGNFLLQAALHDLLVAEGIRPDAVIGHSAGEVAAAYAAGIYTLEEAARVAVVRGRLQATLAGRGVMLAVGLSEAEAAEAIADLPGVSLAAINDHQAVTVAGDASQIAELEQRMRDQRIFAKTLRVEVPYHSPVMDEIAADLADQMSFIEPKPARLPIYSTVSGSLSTGEEWGAGYWPRNVRLPVRFAQAVELALADGSTTFVELAPHPVLTPSIEAMARNAAGVSVTPLLSRRDDEYRMFVGAVGKLALEGLGRPPRIRSAPLPTPVRSPQKVWDQDPWYDVDRANSSAVPGLTLLGRRVSDHNDEFDVELSISDQPWLEGHTVQGLGPVVPATLWAELLALAATLGDERSVTLTDLTIAQGLPVFANPALVRIKLGGGVGRCYSRPLGDTAAWTLNAVASIGTAVPTDDVPAAGSTPPGSPGVEPDALYSLFRLKGLQYGGAFRNLTEITVGEGGAAGATLTENLVAWATIDAGVPYRGGRHAPWVLDAGLQLLIAAARDLGEAMYLPFRLGRVGLHRPMAGDRPWRARAEVTSRTRHELVGSVQFFDLDGTLVAELADVACVRNQSDDAARASYLDRNTYTLHAVTPDEVRERFTDIDADDADDALAGEELPLLAGDDLLIDLTADGDRYLTEQYLPEQRLEKQYLDEGMAPVAPRLDEYIVAGSGPLPLTAPVVELGQVPRGQRAHLLWAAPIGHRTADATATFDLVNQVAALEDPTLTLTLVGDVGQHWLLGLRRSATNSFGFPVRAVLADPLTPVDVLAHWIGEVSEYEVRIDGEVGLSRLEQVGTDTLLAYDPADREPDTTLAFDLASAGRLEVTAEPVRPPGPGEITIENWAVPLTWKDVGKAFGTLGTNALATFAGLDLGLGAAGWVVEAGSGTPFAPGDLVGGPVRRPFRQRLTVNVADEYIRPLSDQVEVSVQLALMMPWVTALAALDDVARIRPGDTVFVQSGAGALGSVLCRHALSTGCRVVASVGSEAKVAALHDLFAEEAAAGRLTAVVARGAAIPGALLAGGHGPFDCIAAVVNGEARSLLFNQLRNRGRYVDLGKPSGPDEVQLALAVDGNRTLSRIDTDQIAADDPDWFNDLITRALAQVQESRNRTPVTRYHVDQLPAAVADLARGETVGSLVVELTPEPAVARARRAAPVLDPNGIYLITGGYGGVGLMAAQWMASRGARTIVVTGRSGRVPEQSQGLVGLIEACGAEVQVVAADVADREGMAALVRRLRADKPIRGVLHAAGVIADGPFTEIDGERVARSFGAKVDGIANLVAGLDQLPGAWEELEFLLLASSMSGALGVSLQGTYAAANTELDGWAADLRARGIRACAMQLGPIEEAGMAAGDERNSRFFAANGLSMVSPRRLFGILDAAATTRAPVFLTAEVDWQRVGRSEPGNASSSVIRHLVAAASGGGDRAELEQLLQLGVEDRADVLTLMLLGLFTAALGTEDGALEADASFADLGIDSLAVVEIQVGINEILQHEVPLSRLFLPDGTIGQLATRIAEYLDEAVIDIDPGGGSGGDPGPGAAVGVEVGAGA
ncbi:MAG: SDR family NAD(P)-dependent oxidoreductase [Acidimicrobiales bacterium]